MNIEAFIDKWNCLRISTGIPDAKQPLSQDIICVVDIS